MLGKPAVQKLDLTRVNVGEIKSVCEYVKQKFSELFKGIRSLPGFYKIELDPKAVPYSQKVAPNIPILLHKKVQVKLKHM